jgi:SET domain-containing protein|tara:strand:+ start:805 stop:1311 length:507 start_codon:yes stop_codon:yes gene_type:complete
MVPSVLLNQFYFVPTSFGGAMQVAYELKASPIAGMGLFATTPLKRGALLWRCDSTSVRTHTEATLRAKLSTCSAAAAKELLEHMYAWEGEVVEIIGDGKYWNHSTTPNTGNHPDEAAGDGVSSYALRDIAAGEELLDDYSAHSSVPWFEELCRQYDAISCTQIGHQFG